MQHEILKLFAPTTLGNAYDVLFEHMMWIFGSDECSVPRGIGLIGWMPSLSGLVRCDDNKVAAAAVFM